MSKNNNASLIIKSFYALGTLFLVFGFVAALEDIFVIMPYWVRGIVLFLSAYIILFFSNIIEG